MPEMVCGAVMSVSRQIDFFDSFAIMDGVRYALSCPWPSAGEPIPAFLDAVKNHARRAEARRTFRAPQVVDTYKEDWKRREEAIHEARKKKNAESIAALHASHPDERYDRKTKTWVPVTGAVTADDAVMDVHLMAKAKAK